MSSIAKRISKPVATMFVLVLLLIASAIPAHAADVNSAKKVLAAGMQKNQAEIDISAYGIPYSSFNDYYHEWHYKGELPWYVNGCNYSYRNGIITTVRPYYWDPSIYSRTQYDRELNRILNEAVLPGMSDWQKALSLYNHLAAQTAYSETFPETGGIQRNAYGAIVNKDAVCVGYAHAYMELLSRCGIKSVMVSSESMNHAWNLVLIRGNWYHVDVTWGDPLMYDADSNGVVDHNYFLLSDEAISDSEHNHHGWDRYYECPDTFFDTGTFWNDMNNHIWYMDDSVSFLRESTNKEIKIIRRDEYTAKGTVLCTITPTTVNITGTSYYYANYGISLWNDMIYFSDAAKVYAISPAGGDPEVIYTYNTAANGKTIFGSYVRDNTIYLTVKDAYNNTSKITVPLPRASHTHDFAVVDYEPTCMAKGYTRFTCLCGDTFNSGHLDIVDHHADQFTVTAEPTWDNAGMKEYQCIWCSKITEESIPALNTVSGTFRDVSTNAYYGESVLWAYVRGVTGGVNATTFAPNNTCTRAQVVTFLWRAAGQPEPKTTKNPFTDVSEGAYYYKAVLWAVENGITGGTGPTTFAPNNTCTRGHVVTFLWRYAGSPTPMEPDRIPFVDVDPNAYYITAMVWAVENSITGGTGPATFAPGKGCTRAQVVTFLHRALTPSIAHTHSYTAAEIVDATCAEDGYKLMVCSCGDSYKETIEKTDNHELKEYDYQAPTYTEKGYTALKCTVCGSRFIEWIDPLPQPSPSPTVTPRPTVTPTVTPKPTVTPTVTPKPTVTPTVTPRPTVTPTVTPKPTVTPTVTPKPTVTPTVTPKPTVTPTPTPEIVPSQSVWVTSTDGIYIYHKDPLCEEICDSVRITLQQAISMGFTPCRLCS